MKFMRSAALAALVLAPTAGLANCLASDTFVTQVVTSSTERCVMVLNEAEPAPASRRLRAEPSRPAYAVGDAFPVYEHNMLIDPPRHGLPPVSGNWRYYRAEGHTYKVDSQSFAVLEVVDEGNGALLN
ncbi:MAG: hypothetical protein H5U17_06165 [Defluviimonas sp.]|nr:hypothetical protein [Defluviimonas sp.]